MCIFLFRLQTSFSPFSSSQNMLFQDIVSKHCAQIADASLFFFNTVLNRLINNNRSLICRTIRRFPWKERSNSTLTNRRSRAHRRSRSWPTRCSWRRRWFVYGFATGGRDFFYISFLLLLQRAIFRNRKQPHCDLACDKKLYALAKANLILFFLSPQAKSKTIVSIRCLAPFEFLSFLPKEHATKSSDHSF